MTNLDKIKQPARFIEINNVKYEIKFTLSAFAYLEEKFGTVADAIRRFNDKEDIALKEFFKAGLSYKKLEYEDSKLVFTEEILTSIAFACSESLCKDYDLNTAFDWNLLYYIARPLSQLSEEEFWNSTPCKILGALKVYEQYTMKTNQNNMINELMHW